MWRTARTCLPEPGPRFPRHMHIALEREWSLPKGGVRRTTIVKILGISQAAKYAYQSVGTISRRAHRLVISTTPLLRPAHPAKGAT